MEELILSDLRNYLGDDIDDTTEAALVFCASRAVAAFKAKRNYPRDYSPRAVAADMGRYHACVFDLALYWVNKQGFEFQTSHTENSTSINFTTEEDIFTTHGVIPIARIV